MNRLLNRVVILILMTLLFITLIPGKNYSANDNKQPFSTIPLNQVSEMFLKEYILKQIPRDAKLISVKKTVVYFNDNGEFFKSMPVNPTYGYYPFSKLQWGNPYYYLSNVSGPYKAWSTQYVAKVAGGKGPTIIHMLQSSSISNSFSANVSVSADVVPLGVGFNVTASNSTTLRCDLSIPKDSFGAIKAHPIYNVYNYDVMYNPNIGSPYKVGEGNASKAVGIFYLTYTWK